MPKLLFRRNIFFALFVMLLVFLQGISALAGEVTTLVSEETITRGAVLQQHIVKTATGTAKVYVTKINLQDPYIKIDVLYGINGKLGKNQTVDKMAEENGAIAAINGDFFDMSSGSLFGPLMQEGQWITTPTTTTEGLSGFALTNSGQPDILSFSFQSSIITENGQIFPVASINKTYTIANKINIFNSSWDADYLPAGSLDAYTYVVVEDNEVEDILVDSKPNRIPKDGYVILGHGLGADFLRENVTIGEEIEFDFQMDQGDDWQFVIGAHTPLVENGARAKFTRNITGYHARTSIGYSKDKKYVYWFGVENSNTSTGMTLEELADFMISLGVDRGVNLDGGGSTTVVSRHLGDTNISLINNPEKLTLRSVPNGLGLYSTAPEGKLKDFIIGAPSFLLVNESTILSLKAVDEYDNPIDPERGEIAWKVSNDTAVVEKNKLTGTKPGNADIEIQADQIKKQLNLEIVGRDQISQLDLGLNSLLLNPGDVFSLNPFVTTKNGQTRQVSPSLFDWEWIGVEGGYKEGDGFQTGTSTGSGWLVGSYDRFSSMIPVQIGTTNQVIMDFENKPKLNFQGVPQEVTGEFILNESEKKEGKYSGSLTYDFSQATADTQAAYGQFNSEEISFSGAAKGMTLWVYGAANNYWLRGEITDQNGQIQYLTLADKVNWSGWKEISVDFPQAIEKPVLKRIYLVNLKSSSGQKTAQGRILLDKIAYKTAEPIALEADVNIKLFANQKRMLINSVEQVIDQGPIVEQGRSYIPARFMIEALGGKVFWDASDKRVRILLGDDMIDLWVNDKEHTIVNGVNKPYDTAPIIRNSRTLIPVRMVTENIGYKVDWLNGEITIH